MSTAKTKPIIGYVVSLIGGLIILLAAIVYLATGNPVAGIVGIIFVILIIIFARRGYLATDKKRNSSMARYQCSSDSSS